MFTVKNIFVSKFQLWLIGVNNYYVGINICHSKHKVMQSFMSRSVQNKYSPNFTNDPHTTENVEKSGKKKS
jgi:hypothetical protein